MAPIPIQACGLACGFFPTWKALSWQPRKPLAERWKRTWDDPCLLQRWWNVSCPLHKFLGVLNEWLDQFGGGLLSWRAAYHMIVLVDIVVVVVCSCYC